MSTNRSTRWEAQLSTRPEHEPLPPEGTIVTAWGYPRLSDRSGPWHRGAPHTGTLRSTRNPHLDADEFWLAVEYPRSVLVGIDPTTITPAIPGDTTGPTVGLVPSRWHLPSDHDARIEMEMFAPHGHAGWVTVTLSAQPVESTAGVEARLFFRACTHLTAGRVRDAYETGHLLVPEPFEPRHHTIELAFGEVEALLRSGKALPEVGEFEDKIALGWSARDLWSEWPLTLYDLVDDGAGGALLTLEIDAENGPILTFDIPVPETVLSTRSPRPATSTVDPFWRAAVGVAVAMIAAMDDGGEIVTPDRPVAMSVTIDSAEAAHISSDTVLLDRLIESKPTRWPTK